jgi:hypothetical protein
LEEGGSATGVLITDRCRYRAVMRRPWSRSHFGAGQYCSHPPRINVLLTNQDTGGFKISTNALKSGHSNGSAAAGQKNEGGS